MIKYIIYSKYSNLKECDFMVEKQIIKGRAPFSDAVRVGHSVFISGQIPKDPIKGGWADNIRGQTTQCLENIKTILEKAGGDVTDLVKLAIYLTNIKEYGGMNEAFLDFFKENGVEKDFPARTAVQVGPLFYHEWKIEIEAVAIIKEIKN